jgi:UDP-glucose 4-epimerase
MDVTSPSQKIIVTGGAGFIASHVVDAYVELGHEVVVVDNLSTGKTEFVNPKARFVEADITNKEQIQSIVLQEKPTVINHHAAHIQVGNSVKNPQFDAENNILGLLHIMEAAKEVGVKRVLMASTGGAMYGNKPVPFNETMEAQPVSPYGVSKRSGELYLHYYYEQYGISYTALRYANVYGPRQNPHGESGVVAIFSEMMAAGKAPIINGDGTHTRDYVFVSDVVKANVAALTSTYIGVLNIGTGVETSTNEVFDKVVAAMGLDMKREYGPARPGEQVQSVLSYVKAQEILDWQPTVAFDEGVQKVVEWYGTKTDLSRNG